jgi:HEAT repeat protein
MKRMLMLALVMCLATGPWAYGETLKGGRRADAELGEALAAIGPLLDAVMRPGVPGADAPRLLLEALRSGTADAETAAAILRWVLHEKEERVAAGFIDALKAVPTVNAVEGERWHDASRNIIAVFEGLLRDTQVHRRRDGQSTLRDLEPAIKAAAPALADALREAGPAAQAQLRRAVQSLAPVAKDIVPPLTQALGHGEAAVRRGAASALGALGPAAREAVPQLSTLLDDADAAVRAAAAEALKQIQGN